MPEKQGKSLTPLSPISLLSLSPVLLPTAIGKVGGGMFILILIILWVAAHGGSNEMMYLTLGFVFVAIALFSYGFWSAVSKGEGELAMIRLFRLYFCFLFWYWISLVFSFKRISNKNWNKTKQKANSYSEENVHCNWDNNRDMSNCITNECVLRRPGFLQYMGKHNLQHQQISHPNYHYRNQSVRNYKSHPEKNVHICAPPKMGGARLEIYTIPLNQSPSSPSPLHRLPSTPRHNAALNRNPSISSTHRQIERVVTSNQSRRAPRVRGSFRRKQESTEEQIKVEVYCDSENKRGSDRDLHEIKIPIPTNITNEAPPKWLVGHITITLLIFVSPFDADPVFFYARRFQCCEVYFIDDRSLYVWCMSLEEQRRRQSVTTLYCTLDSAQLKRKILI